MIRNKQRSPPKIKSNILKPQVMKKTALTIGLFSLVVLATSFSAPIDGGAAGGVIKKKDSYAMLPIDGGAAGGVIKKKDDKVNFASVNQVIGNDKKVD